MQTLRERIEIIKGYADQLRESQTQSARFAQFKTRAKQLHETTGTLQAHAKTVEVLKSAGLKVSLPKLSRELKGKPAAMLQAFREDPTSFVSDNQFGVTFKAPLDAYNEKLADGLTKTWQSHVAAIVPPINEGTLTTLQCAGLAAPVALLRALVAEMRNVQRRLPTNPNDVAGLAGLGMQAQEAWAEIGQVPPAVQTFLRKASSRDATFADLTDEVRAWLSSKGLIGHLRISLAQ